MYCIVEGAPQNLLYTGIDGNNVHMIPHKDISAVVHACKSEPYKSDDFEVVKRWVMQHQEVVDVFCQRFDAVLPAAFDTIIKGTDDKVKQWLNNDFSNIRRKMDKVRGKHEFGIQIFWDSKIILDEIAKQSTEIKNLKDAIHFKSRGISYMNKQRYITLLKKELETRVDEYFRNFYDEIRKQVDDMHIEKIPVGGGDQQMIMNLSCLLSKDRVKDLGDTLDRIARTPNFSVRFTGPWPAYSFMT